MCNGILARNDGLADINWWADVAVVSARRAEAASGGDGGGAESATPDDQETLARVAEAAQGLIQTLVPLIWAS